MRRRRNGSAREQGLSVTVVREMQTGTTARGHFTPMKIAKAKRDRPGFRGGGRGRRGTAARPTGRARSTHRAAGREGDTPGSTTRWAGEAQPP